MGDTIPTLREDPELSMTELTSTETSLELVEEVTKIINHEFIPVFATLRCLPQKREAKHAIQLAPGEQRVNLKTYKYFHFRKDEIEKLTKELAEDELSRSSLRFCPKLGDLGIYSHCPCRRGHIQME